MMDMMDSMDAMDGRHGQNTDLHGRFFRRLRGFERGWGCIPTGGLRGCVAIRLIFQL